MVFKTPTYKESVERVKSLFNANLPGVDSFIVPNFVGAVATIVGMVKKSLHDHIDFNLKQAFVHLCAPENVPLHATEYGLSRRPATVSVGAISFDVDDGVSIPSGTLLTASNGVEYQTTATITGTGGGADIAAAESTVPGLAGNITGGAVLNLSSAIAGVNAVVVDEGGMGGGSDLESIDAFRGRVLLRKYFIKIQGTSDFYRDYLFSNYAGVTRVFTDGRIDNTGQHFIYPMMDDTYADGLPQPSDITNIQTLIDDNLDTTGAFPTVVAPTLTSIDVAVTIFEDFTENQRTNIDREINDYIRFSGKFSKVNAPSRVPREGIDQSVARGLGGTNFQVTLPSSDITIPAGGLPSKGNVTITRG